MLKFIAKIEIIGINPYVLLPEKILNALIEQAGKHKGKIPVRMKIDGHEFTQTLVKYAGHWRLYLHAEMRKAAQKQLGEEVSIEIAYDPEERIVPIHPKLQKALDENPQASEVFAKISPSLRLEIVRYFTFLKTEASIDKNVLRAINFLEGRERFVGRDKP